jgi:hypothetical protein
MTDSLQAEMPLASTCRSSRDRCTNRLKLTRQLNEREREVFKDNEREAYDTIHTTNRQRYKGEG